MAGAPPEATLENAPTKATRPRSKTTQVKPSAEENGQNKGKSGWGSQESLGSSTSLSDRGDRGTSATSKVSHHSMDSGFADNEYQKVITESSQADRVKEVEETFSTPRNLDLGVSGTACVQRGSAKDKDRLDEQRVMAALHNEGLIARPVSRAAFGVSFDIVAENTALFGGERRPPLRLAKLEKRRRKKKRVLTEEEIQEKLERAERRKKEQEELRLAKIQSLTKSNVQSALESFADRQQTVEQSQKSKEDQVAENREKRLKEMRDKLKAKQEYAEAVRKRKAMAPIQIPESPRSGSLSARSVDGRPCGFSTELATSN